jgi:DNA-binding HxlR family transcriptional regulator
MEEETEIEEDRQRAEVFDALGHPTRIVILKVLNEGAVGFADLKKKTAIESSGHLQHHLNKLNGLIKTDEYGKYCLSDQGQDALLTVQTVENVSSIRGKKNPEKTQRRFKTKMGLKSVTLLLAALLIASSAVALFQCNQTFVLQKELARANGINFEAITYYNEFEVIPDTNVNSSFSPPVSMYRALQMALQADGWNKTSLNSMRVGAYLMNWEEVTEPAAFNRNNTNTMLFYITAIGSKTSPPSDYSNVYGNGIIYKYVWQITVQNMTGIIIPPIGETWIDAATGQTLIIPQLVGKLHLST